MGLATLALGVRKHRGACKLRNSCLRSYLSWVMGDRALGPSFKDWTLAFVLLRSCDSLVFRQIHFRLGKMIQPVEKRLGMGGGKNEVD